jgi:hypothetical protein
MQISLKYMTNIAQGQQVHIAVAIVAVAKLRSTALDKTSSSSASSSARAPPPPPPDDDRVPTLNPETPDPNPDPNAAEPDPTPDADDAMVTAGVRSRKYRTSTRRRASAAGDSAAARVCSMSARNACRQSATSGDAATEDDEAADEEEEEKYTDDDEDDEEEEVERAYSSPISIGPLASARRENSLSNPSARFRSAIPPLRPPLRPAFMLPHALACAPRPLPTLPPSGRDW